MLEKISKKMYVFIIFIILAFISIINIIYDSVVTLDVSEYVNINHLNPIFLLCSIILAFIIILVCNYLETKIKNKKIFNLVFIGLIAIYVIFNIIWIFKSQMMVVGDQDIINQSAINWYENGLEILKSSGYLNQNPHQLGMVIFLRVLYGIFGSTNYKILQMVNILAMIGIIIILYKIMIKDKYFDHSNSFLYLVLSLGFIPLFLLTIFVYGDYIGLLFAIIGIYGIILYKSDNKIIYLIISVIFEALAYFVKTNYIIFILGIVIYLLLELFKDIKNKSISRFYILLKIFFIICYFLITILPFSVVKKYMCNKLEYNNEFVAPTSMFVTMGITEGPRANGWCNNYYLPFDRKEIYNNDKEYKDIIKERIKTFVKNPIYAFKFYLYKNVSAWCDVTFQSIWYNYPLMLDNDNYNELASKSSPLFKSFYDGKINKCIRIWQKALIILILFGSIYYIYKKRKNPDNNLMLFGIIFIGGFLFNNIWEIKSRYVLVYIILLIPMATIGISLFIRDIKTRKERCKNGKKENISSNTNVL